MRQLVSYPGKRFFQLGKHVSSKVSVDDSAKVAAEEEHAYKSRGTDASAEKVEAHPDVLGKAQHWSPAAESSGHGEKQKEQTSSRETQAKRMKWTQLSWPKPDLELIGLGAKGRLWLKKSTRQSGLMFPFTGPAIEQGISPDSLFYFSLKMR